MVSRLEVAHARRRRNINNAASRSMRRAWIDADGWDEDRFVEQASSIERDARTRTVAEQDAYLAAALTSRGATASPVGLDPDDYARPVHPDQRWRRPFMRMRMQLDQGEELPRAMSVGMSYAENSIKTDLQYAMRTSARDWMRGDRRVAGWSRVLGEGGESGENCGLCIVASTQRYHVDDLMPIHDHCTCDVVPILGDRDPGRVIREDGFDEVFGQLDEMDGQYANRSDLGRVRINASELPRPVIHQHGELGPVLYDSSWHFDAAA